MTPSCNSPVTLDKRCNGTLNSDSSLRRAISISWFLVKTSSDTMVIKSSSVSTLTRRDCVETAALALGSFFTSAAFAGFATSSGLATSSAISISTSVSLKARSSSSSDTSPTRKSRSISCTTTGASAFSSLASASASASAGLSALSSDFSAPPPSSPRLIAFNASIRSASLPSGSTPSASSSVTKISLRRSIDCRIKETPSSVTGLPSRYLPISVSDA